MAIKRIKVTGIHKGMFGDLPDLTVGREYDVLESLESLEENGKWLAQIHDDTGYLIFVASQRCAHGGEYEVVA